MDDNIKKKAKDLIDNLPDDANWDDVMYHFYVRAKIQAGVVAADAGKVVPHDQVVQKFRHQVS